ncbi:MAG: NUDIX domain-containing protein, partial [Chryseobacterium sp.]
MSFSNPVPVAVALVPYNNSLVGIRRGIEPRKGLLAFPGGYINTGETFKEALSREVLEETGITIPTESWELFHIGDSIQSN